ncbi:hypothetical protein AC579_8440 [Pseudocercospora musae]|uniref:Uncharacterized protein n=1 Tax=Pseudocercospora musae TaxID=113226 RepID=A0A139I3U6_9PEZI|nr:hypothetical protein AC579_8440 [Pseudocercospora musae]
MGTVMEMVAYTRKKRAFSDVLETLCLRGYNLRREHRIKARIDVKLPGIAVASEQEWSTVGQIVEEGKRTWL